MTKVSAFSFTCKSHISLSGVAIRISSLKKNQNYTLFRQFDNHNRELLYRFSPGKIKNKILKFDIHSKNRDIYSIIKSIQSKLNYSIDNNSDITDILDGNDPLNSEILRLWQECFNSEEFIKESYKGYIFSDKLKNLWIYDIVPATKEFSQVDKGSPLPTPGSFITYSIEVDNSHEEIFRKRLIIPDTLSGKVELFDLFEYNGYLYHLALYYNKRLIWSKFTYNSSKKRSKFLQDVLIHRKDFICNIKPDINSFPNFNPDSYLFTISDNPPILSSTELMETILKITKIKTDTSNPNTFNYISFESRIFRPSDFPRTFSLIYPYR